MSDRETISVYDARAGEYAERFASEQPDNHLAAFIAVMPEGARVLDLGCGPGHAARLMAEAGLDVEAWDASAEMVARAAAHPGVTARQATFDALEAEAQYDGIWANFSLLHAPRAAFASHLAAIARALRPGGLLHLGMKTGEGAARDALGRAYTYYTVEDLESRLARAGLTVISRTEGRGRGLAGTVDPWVILLARRDA